MQQKLLKIAKAVLGDKLFEMLMKSTFYGHFVAGEDRWKIIPTLERFHLFSNFCFFLFAYYVSNWINPENSVGMCDNKRLHDPMACSSHPLPFILTLIPKKRVLKKFAKNWICFLQPPNKNYWQYTHLQLKRLGHNLIL